MSEAIDSPDGIELKGKPKLGSRFGMKAGFIVGTVIFIALGLIIFGIATREPAGIRGNGDEANKNMTPATGAGKRLYEGVPDGLLAKEEPPALVGSAPPPMASSNNGTTVPALQPQGSTPGTVTQPGPTPEQLAAQRLRELREQERFKAITADSGVSFRDASLAAAPAAPPELQKMMAGLTDAAKAASAGGAGFRGQTPAPAFNPDGMDQNMQSRKENFLAAAADSEQRESLRGTRRLARTAYELKAGAIIPAVLLTGLNSDLPGELIGQVSENVYDTSTGRFLLIPQGSRLFGKYDSRVAFGQERALVAWDRLIYPDGSSVSLEGMGGTDKSGYAGMKDQVNNHIWRLIGYGALSSAFASVFQITQKNQQSNGFGNTQSSSQIASAEVGRQFSQLGMQMAQRNLNIQPTIEIRPGYQFNVMVSKDVALDASYSDRTAQP